MRLFCWLGWHSPGPQILWNAGFWFTKCRDCERDLVRSRHRGWHVPVGAKVVWQTKAPAPRPPADPAMAAEPPRGITLVVAPAPAALVSAAVGLAPDEASAPSQHAEPGIAEPRPVETQPVETQPVYNQAAEPQPLAPAERLDLAQFVAEMLHSAGPAVPIQHAVLGDERGRLADSSDDTEPSHAPAIETDTVEGLVSSQAGAETDLHDSGEAADDLAQTLVPDTPPPPAPDEPLELGVELDAPQGEAPAADRDPQDAVADPVGEPDLAQTAQPHDAMALDPAIDAADPDAEAPASSAAAEPVPAAPAATADADPWADFLADDDDDDDFAWTQENRPETPAAARGAPERPAAPRAAPERPVGGGERSSARRLHEPFRSDLDGRKRWSRNSVKR